MALVDDIEFYGRAVAAGEMSRAQAVASVMRASSGGLTERGADDLIANWEAARPEYEAGANRTFHRVAAIKNGRRPHPSAHREQRG